MALGDFMASRQRCEDRIVSRVQVLPQVNSLALDEAEESVQIINMDDAVHEARSQVRNTNMIYLPESVFFSDAYRDIFDASSSTGPAEPGLISKIRMKDRMKTGYVALVLCLNVGVDPPDVIKISPCARLECWIDPSSMPTQKAIDAIGKKLQAQYMLWQPKAKYKLQPDPTIDEIKKLCLHCRKSAKTERVLFHYNGHGVPKPTVNGEIWLFNKSYTQYIPLSVYELETWLGTPSIYVLDCSAAGMIVNAFCERPEFGFSSSVASAMKECILLAACGAQEILPQQAELPADLFTSCLTTPITIALRWFCRRSLLRDSIDPDLIDKIPGRQNDRRTPLGELNWIFTAITDTIAWNVLPRELFQRLFRQDLLVASLFRNFLLAERIMRAANCCPLSYPHLPATHQHHMWHAWDMAAEICLSQLPKLLNGSAEFQPSPFFTEQLTAFELWLAHGSHWKKPPEQLPIVLQVLLSQSHRFRALLLLGRFLDMGAWAVDLALSVGIFPYVLKLLQTTAVELRQILVFIWTKILALDKSCQVDLVKDGGHQYFIRFLDTPDIFPEQRAMAAFVLAVIVDGHRKGQEECMQCGLTSICLKYVERCIKRDEPSQPLLRQWLCLCMGKMWEGYFDAQQEGLQMNAASLLQHLLSEMQPQVRAAATFALGMLISGSENVHDDVVSDNSSLDGCDEEDERLRAEQEVASILLMVLYDGSPLVRAELAIGLSRFAVSHNKQLKAMATACLKAPSSSLFMSFPALSSGNSVGSISDVTQVNVSGSFLNAAQHSRVLSDSAIQIHANLGSSPGAGFAPSCDAILHPPEGPDLLGNGTPDGNVRSRKQLKDETSYFNCVSAFHTLSRDPFPPVASLGRQLLRMIGLEPSVRPPVAGCQTSGPTPNHQRKASLGAVPSSMLSGIPRSFSWIDSSSGNLAATFRTPPASPPATANVLVGTGIRRVCSLEFSPHMRKSSDSRLGDAVVGGSGPLGSMSIPPSNLYRWSCSHFSRPLLEASLEDNDDESRCCREERERIALDGISKCQHSNITRVSEQIASWDMDSQNSVQAVMLHPFLPLVLSFDENEIIRVWDYEDGTVVNVFDNHDALVKGVSRMCLLNELDDSLLLLVSRDGCARVWKDYTQKDKQCLITAWQSIAGLQSGSKALVDWQQLTGFLFASGGKTSIAVWDLNQELITSNIESQSDSPFSCLTASQGLCKYVAAGCFNGAVKIFDIRSRDIVCSRSVHKQMVVNAEFLPGIESTKIVSASTAGDLRFLDLRMSQSPYLEVDAHKNSLSALAVHRHAPFIATGSSKQYIKVFNLEGEQLSVIRYHNSFMGQRIGPVSALSFHTYKVYLAAGATDSNVSIYSGDSGLA